MASADFENLARGVRRPGVRAELKRPGHMRCLHADRLGSLHVMDMGRHYYHFVGHEAKKFHRRLVDLRFRLAVHWQL